jgi:D-lactate dehydrogenase
MVVSFFSTKSYDKEYFNQFNNQHDFRYFEAALSEETVKLANDSQAVCVFVNDKVTEEVVRQLSSCG